MDNYIASIELSGGGATHDIQEYLGERPDLDVGDDLLEESRLRTVFRGFHANLERIEELPRLLTIGVRSAGPAAEIARRMQVDPNPLLGRITREGSERSMPMNWHRKTDGAERIRRVTEFGSLEELCWSPHLCARPSYARVRRVERSAGGPIERSGDALRVGDPIERNTDSGEDGEQEDNEQKPGFAGNAVCARSRAHSSSPQLRRLIFIV